MKTVNYLIAAAFGMTLLSCSEDEVAVSSQSQPQVSFSFNTDQTSRSVSSGRVAANSLQFTEGFITIREIRFEAEVGELDTIEWSVEKVAKIDFATGKTDADLGSLGIQPGTYSEVEVEIELQDEGDSPAVVITGTFTDSDNQTHPIRFEFNSGETFEVEKEGVITFEQGETVLTQVTFNPALWFARVTSEELQTASKNSQGIIVISETQNAEIFDIVADGLNLASEIEISK